MKLVLWIAGSAAALGVIAVAVFAITYGTLDPCRALAKEMAGDAYAPLAGALGGDPDAAPPPAAERMMRIATSQMETGECWAELRGRWMGADGE